LETALSGKHESLSLMTDKLSSKLFFLFVYLVKISLLRPSRKVFK
jgi:hypothetical protein